MSGIERDASDADDLALDDACKLIGVSLPTLIRLLDSGAIADRRTTGVGGDRRVSRRSAFDFLRADVARRRHALDDLALDAEALGFFDDKTPG